MGIYDKLIRLGISIVLIVLYYNRVFVNQTIGIIVLTIALILTLTSLISFSPIYSMFGFSSCKNEKN
jgi:hypothetical protein